MLTCPNCGSTGTLMIEPFMRGSCDSSGPLDYFRCGSCRGIVSRLTRPDSAEPASESSAAGAIEH
jgi:hypothetical protein